MSENLKFTQPDLVYDPIIQESDAFALDVFFSHPPEDAFIANVQKHWPHVHCQIHREENRDWLEEWKKGFTAFRLTGPYWIVPSWLPVPEGAERPLLIDPGLAFGTGTHATTQLASQLILSSKEENPTKFQKRSLLDVGTGTGILCMVATHEGFGPVVGNDIDPVARRVARENVALNASTQIEITDQSVQDIDVLFDVVVANIIDGVLITLKDALINRLKSGGELILSGILLERESVFKEQFLNGIGRVLERRTQDEWVAYRVAVENRP